MKVIFTNHTSYVTKALRHPIMKRSYLENFYFKEKDSRIFDKV